jgi:hypothetical protein
VVILEREAIEAGLEYTIPARDERDAFNSRSYYYDTPCVGINAYGSKLVEVELVFRSEYTATFRYKFYAEPPKMWLRRMERDWVCLDPAYRRAIRQSGGYAPRTGIYGKQGIYLGKPGLEVDMPASWERPVCRMEEVEEGGAVCCSLFGKGK